MTDVWTHRDPLSEALHFLRMDRSALYFTELSTPWQLAMPAGCTNFYLVSAGGLTVQADRRVELGPGEIALLLHGRPYSLLQGDAPAVSPAEMAEERVSERFRILRHGGGGAVSRFLCGAVRFGHPTAEALIRLLPEVLSVRFDAAETEAWLRPLITLMAGEAKQLQPGWETVSARLADVLILQAIRTWIAAQPQAPGWLGALRDPQISHVLALMHAHPERLWQLESLAAEAAMSRSAFAERFRRLVGEPPLAYLTRWRMQTAHSLLRQSTVPLSEVATACGYGSEAAFHRAFRRWSGSTPAEVRRG